MGNRQQTVARTIPHHTWTHAVSVVFELVRLTVFEIFSSDYSHQMLLAHGFRRSLFEGEGFLLSLLINAVGTGEEIAGMRSNIG